MEQKVEREWKNILCPENKDKTRVMCEWDVVSKQGRIIKKTLKQIDCSNPKLIEFGGADCHWTCEKVLAKAEIGDL